MLWALWGQGQGTGVRVLCRRVGLRGWCMRERVLGGKDDV